MARNNASRKELLAQVSRLQKRTRDKEYHLRKRGATPVRMETPRVNWSEVKGMTTKQLRSYTNTLDSWNQQRMTVLPNGDVIPRSTITAINRNIHKHNKKAAAQRKALNRNISINGEDRERLGLVQEAGTARASGLRPIDTIDKPESASQAAMLLTRSKKWANSSYKSRLKAQRRSAVAMLRNVGMDREAAQISNMKTSNFALMVESEGLLDDLALWYHSDSNETQKEIGYDPDSYAVFASRTRDAIQALNRRR